MFHPQLYDVVLTLSKAELRRCAKLVRSPFFTHRSEMERMFSYLAICLYRGKPLPDKATLFQKSFPEKPFDDLLLRATMSDLKELIEEFLVWQKMRMDSTKAGIMLAAEYRKRNLSKFFEKTAQRLEKEMKQAEVQNVDFLQRRLDFQLEMAQFQTRTKRATELPLQEISNSLDTVYLAQKLRHACTQLSHQAVFKMKYDFGLLPNVIGEVEQGGYLDTPAVALYYFCFRFLTKADGLPFFLKFREELRQHGHYFPDDELKDLYLLAINFCIRKLNEGEVPFIKEGWELYQDGLEKGFLIEHGRLSAFTFNNVVAFGIRLKEYQQVERFIEKYQSKLDPSQQESFVHFNHARLEYAKGDLKGALGYLQTADFSDLVNNLIAKTLQMRIYFEMGEFDLLDSHLDSFRSFIRRRELSDFHHRNYTNIISYMKKIMTVPPGDRAASNKLRQQIQDEKLLSEKSWMLKQI
ncbi:MAG: hypothetical protein H6577_22880 [Lewinellaceae bacterium]|nr:hypothetical protein [Saprospiraceae bacterium]MCB9340980.1 hypothetical protein [Lewinellaceae bacterium]